MSTTTSTSSSGNPTSVSQTTTTTSGWERDYTCTLEPTLDLDLNLNGRDVGNSNPNPNSTSTSTSTSNCTSSTTPSMATSNLKHPKIPHPTHPTTFFISTDPTLLDLAYIHNYLSSHSYWAQHIPLEAVRVAVEASFAVGVYMNISKNQNHDEGGSGVQKNGAGKNEEGEGNMHTVIKQVGFARWITDFSTFGYLSDVFVWPGEVCGLGLGKFLVSTSLELLNTHPFRTPKPNHPPLPPIRRLMLATKDATGLYEKYIGFRELAGIRSGPNSETRFMEKLQLPEGGYRSFMEGQSN